MSMVVRAAPETARGAGPSRLSDQGFRSRLAGCAKRPADTLKINVKFYHTQVAGTAVFQRFSALSAATGAAARGARKIQYFELRKLTIAPATEPAATPIAGHSRTSGNAATHSA